VQCVVLAGGLGTRLGSLTETTPKTLVPVAGRPFADWQLRWLAEQGVTDVVYCIGHLGQKIRRFAGDGSSWGLRIRYADEGADLRGTAGAVRLAASLDLLDDWFFVLYGDSYLSVDLRAMARSFTEGRRPALMAVYLNGGRFDRSNVVYDGTRVVRYEKGLPEPPPEMQYIDYGLSALRRDLVGVDVLPDTAIDLASVYELLSRRDLLGGFEATERFYEVGSVDGLRELEARLVALTQERTAEQEPTRRP
jgi:NDP-sugar pyrophosphorylase family protein